MPFAFHTPTTVKLAHINMRPEKHGDESVTALDLKFIRTAPNSELKLLHPKLQSMLYWRLKATNDQRDIEGVEQILPDLRFPELGTLAWDLEMTARIVIEIGTGSIVLNPVKVNQFRIDPLQGGSVETTFRVQTSAIPDGALDLLGRMLDSDVSITLEPHTDKPSEAPKSNRGKSTAPAKDAPPTGEASKAALDASGKNPFPQTPEQALAATSTTVQ